MGKAKGKVDTMRFHYKVGQPRNFMVQGQDLDSVIDAQLREKNTHFEWVKDALVHVDDNNITLTFTPFRVKPAKHEPESPVHKIIGDGDGTTTVFIQNDGSPDYQPVDPPFNTSYSD